MKQLFSILHVGAYIAVALLIAQPLAGCSGTSQTLPVAAAQAGREPHAVHRQGIAPLSDRGDTVQGLLYVAGRLGETYTYSWPELEYVGSLPGFVTVLGICVDTEGNVYFPDFGAGKIDEFSHGGSMPVETITDKDGGPTSCSVDPRTGNLAITNDAASSGGSGNVLVFKKGRGKPTKYIASNLSSYDFAAYDDKSNLFVNGFSGSTTVLAELPKGAGAFKPITMDQSVIFPGGLQWDGKYLAMNDETGHTVYQFAVSGNQATKVGSTPLGSAQNVYQICVTGGTKRHPQGTEVVGADYGADAVFVWSYPAGGAPTTSIPYLNGLPGAVAISVAKD
jgi:hypothetical protein